MRARSVLAAGLFSAVVAAVPAAHAASPCLMVTDAKGDAYFAASTPGDPGLDIVRSTFETAGGHLKARIFVADLGALAVNDRAWMVELSVREQKYSLVAERHADGDVFVATAQDVSAGATVSRNLGRIGGRITPATNEILLDVPLGLLGAREGSKALAISVHTFADTGASGTTVRRGEPDDPYGSVGVYEDAAKGDRDYRFRAVC